jgi:HAD superfamily hydrolase (TIGR01450 family)
VILSPLVARYDNVLLDLDGCVWVGDESTPRAVEAIDALRRAGKGLAFVTNDGRHAGEEFVRKLWSLGCRASIEEIVTVGGALQHVLNEDHSGVNAFVIGSPAIHRHVADAGLRITNGTSFASRAEVVVVSGHDAFTYEELRLATQALLRGAAMLATGRDRTFPMPDGPWPGTGPIIAALENATGVTATSVGKPEAQLFLTALDRLGPGRSLGVGDRLDADLAGAHAAGIDGAIVLTGATSADGGQARAWARRTSPGRWCATRRSRRAPWRRGLAGDLISAARPSLWASCGRCLLIVNPKAGGGRTAKELPAVRRA